MNPGGGGCSEPRLHHCNLSSLGDRARLSQKRKEKERRKDRKKKRRGKKRKEGREERKERGREGKKGGRIYAPKCVTGTILSVQFYGALSTKMCIYHC